ncbi:hypothetical protein ACTHGU_18395 [Chitinophagaceae bacterium MMS25-I14]
MRIVFIFCIMLFTVSCIKSNDDIAEIKMINRSGENITVDYSFSYPDTIAATGRIFAGCEIQQPDTSAIMISKGWKSEFGRNAYKTLVFFIANADSFKAYSLDYIRTHQEQFVKRRYVITLDSMEKANWTITYP